MDTHEFDMSSSSIIEASGHLVGVQKRWVQKNGCPKKDVSVHFMGVQKRGLHFHLASALGPFGARTDMIHNWSGTGSRHLEIGIEPGNARRTDAVRELHLAA
ncbi:MAG TPA: hypothetical protein VFS24_12785, partial [Steroidobacteraceae bacterium]|nr:hypothetical protein [Steroidobacteraceae bacterium]